MLFRSIKIPGSSTFSTIDEIEVHELAHAITFIVGVNNLTGGFFDMSHPKLGLNLLLNTMQASSEIESFKNKETGKPDKSRLFSEIRSVFFENLYRIAKGIVKVIRRFYDSTMFIDLFKYFKPNF